MGQQYGGKGGGMGAGPQLQQPSQSSTTQSQTPQRYQPTGGNVFGYNMNRLASRMDPSASLPGDMTQQQPQYQAQDTFQPQYQPQDTFQGSFGGKGGGRRGYEPDFFEPQYQQQYQQQPQQQPQQQQNPFTPQQPQYDDKFAALQSQLDKLLSQQKGTTTGAKPAADSELSDTGEDIYAMDPGRTATGVGSQAFVPGDATLSPEDVQASQAAATPPPAALTTGAGFRDINSQYGNMLGNVNATVGKNGAISLVSNTNKNIKTTLPAGSYFDSSKNQFVDSSGKAINVGSQFLSPQATNLSSGIQYGDTAADVRTEFGKVVNVTDKAKVNSDGSVTLQNGTKIPANSYIDSNNVLRAPNGSVVAVKPKDLPTAATPAPAPTTSAAAPAPAPATSAPAPAPAPAPAASAPRPAPAPKPAKPPKPAPAPKPAKPPKPAPAPKPAKPPKPTKNAAKGGSIIVHKGMTANLKKQLKNK